MASKTLCARSTVIPWYSLRSSRETWASLTPKLFGQFPLAQAIGDPQGYEQGTYRSGRG